ncbi:DUF4158 domain-containing protein [Nonomuraea fuscirosea]|uniref:DUF4158 domain-containing protein n=1 Tax=Nonomuraea fuscirosea TaxID=1291556 RepID=UPI00343AC755
MGAAERPGVSPAALRLYGKHEQTRSDHLGLIAKYLEWQTAPAGSQAMKELEQFLLDRAMEHDSPTLLFNLARDYLLAAKVIRPGALLLAKMVGTARKDASDLTSQLVGHLLTAELRADLERMLLVDASGDHPLSRAVQRLLVHPRRRPQRPAARRTQRRRPARTRPQRRPDPWWPAGRSR